MALPQKVIEQLGREPAQTPGWSGKLLMFSGTIFFIALSVYFGLSFGYEKYLNDEIQKINDDIKKFGAEVSVADQVKLVSFYSQLGNIKSILSNQTIGLRAFDWIQANVQVNTYIRNLNISYLTGQVSFDAGSITLDDALQQMVWLQKNKEIKSVGIGSISSAGNQWTYGVQVALDKAYFSRSFKAPTSTTK